MKRMGLPWILAGIILAGVLGLFLYYPVAYILRHALFPVDGFSLEFFGVLAGNPMILRSFATSFLMGVTVTLLCVAVSLPLAWFGTRYRLPGHGLLNGFLLLPLILPPFVGAIGMRQFLARLGTLNVALMRIGLLDTPVDWLGSGFWGVVILQALHLFPIVYLNLCAALGGIDPSLEEAAWNLGSGRSKFFRTILMPLAAPGLFAGCAIVFVWSLTDLGTPLILEYRQVVSYQIYTMINDMHENPMGYVLVLLVLAWVAFVYFTSKRLFLGREYASGSRAVRMTLRPSLSRGATVAVTALFLCIGLCAVVPHAMVVLSSVARKWYMTALPEHLTTQFYGALIEHPLTVLGIRNSLLLSSLATLVDIAVGLGAAYLLLRFRFRGRALLEFSVMLPLALPGLVLAFGYVGSFAGTPLDPRANPFPLLIAAYGIRRLPFMVRSLDAGLRQVSLSMEEASFNLGASHGKTMVRITLPLISSHVIAGSILVFCFAMLEVADSLILAMKESHYPLTKAIYALVNRLGDGFPMASALGVFAMVLLGAGMIGAGKVLGRKFGELFRI